MIDTSEYKIDKSPIPAPQQSQTQKDFANPNILERLQNTLYTTDLQGRKVSSTSPTDQQKLTWDSTYNQWMPAGGLIGKMEISSTTSIPTTTWTKIPFDTSIIAVGVTCDTTNHRISVPASGSYHIDAISSIDSLTSGNYFEVRLRVNGSEINYATGRVISNSSSLVSYASLSTIISLNANDYVELFVYQQTGTFNTGTVNSLSLFKI